MFGHFFKVLVMTCLVVAFARPTRAENTNSLGGKLSTKFIPGPLTVDQAKKACADLGPGYRLVENFEVEKVAAYISGYDYVWLATKGGDCGQMVYGFSKQTVEDCGLRSMTIGALCYDGPIERNLAAPYEAKLVDEQERRAVARRVMSGMMGRSLCEKGCAFSALQYRFEGKNKERMVGCVRPAKYQECIKMYQNRDTTNLEQCQQSRIEEVVDDVLRIGASVDDAKLAFSRFCTQD